jgi:hypothetical protein
MEGVLKARGKARNISLALGCAHFLTPSSSLHPQYLELRPFSSRYFFLSLPTRAKTAKLGSRRLGTTKLFALLICIW